jgi:hypothetical protein
MTPLMVAHPGCSRSKLSRIAAANSRQSAGAAVPLVEMSGRGGVMGCVMESLRQD